MTAQGDIQAVTFSLDRETFAVPVEVVREILDWREVFRLPQGPDWMLGLAEVRGEGVPTIDLRVRLGLPRAAPTAATRILVLDVPRQGVATGVGLMVDRVDDVTRFPAAAIDEVPDIGARWQADYMSGVARVDGGFVVLLDVARLFPAEADGAVAA